MPALKSQNHSSLSSYAPPSEPLEGFHEDDGIGAEDIFSMCSLICFIPWRSFLVIPGSSEGGESGNDVKQQEFEKIATDENKQNQSKLPKVNEEQVEYKSVPAWKQKYIARKLDESADISTHSSSSDGFKRNSLEETLKRCRNVDDDDNSSVVSLDGLVDEENEDVSNSWNGFFGLGGASSLISKIVGTSETTLDRTHEIPSSPDHAYSSISPAPQKVKVHRRQLSPSGVMDFAD